MNSHFLEQNLILKSQQGFIQTKSCMTNLIETTHKITEAYNIGLSAAIIVGLFQDLGNMEYHMFYFF